MSLTLYRCATELFRNKCLRIVVIIRPTPKAFLCLFSIYLTMIFIQKKRLISFKIAYQKSFSNVFYGMSSITVLEYLVPYIVFDVFCTLQDI